MSNASGNQSNTQITGAERDAETKDQGSEGGCCGGAAPKGSGACCVKDAQAKQSGAAGCGCNTTSSAGKSGCC